MKTDNFEIKLINTVKKYNMFEKSDRVLVALSGGKDSVALLYSLNRLSNFFGISVCAFHLNHGIRGEEAERDLQFSKSFCESISVPFYSNTVNIPSMDGVSSKGIECIARDVRYSELSRVAKENGCNKIATAHTSGDNTETVLITLLRNSYARGIPPIRDNIVRPIINHSTEEVLEYCKRNSLSFVTDSTNTDTNYTRNFIRNKVLKDVYDLAPSADEAFTNFSAIQRANAELTNHVVEDYFSKNPDPLKLSALLPLAKKVAFYNVLYSILCRGLEISLSYKQFNDILYMLTDSPTGSKVSVGGCRYVMKGYESILLTEEKKHVEDFEIRLNFGENLIPDSNLSLWVETDEEYKLRNKNINQLKINKLSKNNLIKYNIIDNVLVARSRKSGDSYICRGINRSIKKFMVDEKIPASVRSRIPIVCDNIGILWVPGLGVADRVSSSDNTPGNISLSLQFKK